MDHFEYKLNDDNWEYHDDSKLVLGPLAAGRYELLVRAVNDHGIKDPVPARFIWDVNEAVDVQLDNPPVNTKAQTSQVAVNSSSMDLTFSIDGGPKQAGAPAQSARWRRGTIRFGWAGKVTAPLSLRGYRSQRLPLVAWTSVWRWETQVGTSCTPKLQILWDSLIPGCHSSFFADFEPPEAHRLPWRSERTGPSPCELHRQLCMCQRAHCEH